MPDALYNQLLQLRWQAVHLADTPTSVLHGTAYVNCVLNAVPAVLRIIFRPLCI